MDGLILKKAASEDMDAISRMQREVFSGEQRIPPELIPLPVEKKPQWWCALSGRTLAGAVAAWVEQGQIHWGRFATRRDLRGMGVGTRLAVFSLEALFSQGHREIYMEARDATVIILSRMGGKVIGEPVQFHTGTVTPLLLQAADFFAYTKHTTVDGAPGL